MKFLENIFSIKNNSGKKIITILGLKIKISLFMFQRIKHFKNNKPTLAIQVTIMDKGGLEEVVLQLATDKKINEKFNVVIIAESTNKGYLADIAKNSGIPVYSFFNNKRRISDLIKTLNIKIVHFHYNIAGIEEYKNNGVKIIYTIHNNYIWQNKSDIEIRKYFYKFVDLFIAVSTQVKEYFCEKYSIDENEVKVIPNGIKYEDTSNIMPFAKNEIGLHEDDFVLLNVATFNPNKYHFSQLKALSLLVKKYENIKLLFIGNTLDKEYYEKIKEMIFKFKLNNNVKILDYVPKSHIFRYLKTADIFIMTSLTEGFSVSMCEAMLFNKPMILTDVGGARDVIKDNDIGIIVPHAFKSIQSLNIYNVISMYRNDEFSFENVEQITNAIENIYLNKEIWKNKAMHGNEKIKKYFNVERVCEDYKDCYQTILGGMNE